MAIDCYVMPLWRFFAGDFTTAIERFTQGNMRRVILGAEPRVEEPKSSVGIVDRWRAKRKVQYFRRCVSRESGQAVAWTDSGPIAYQSQFHHDDIVSLYIAWRSLQDKLPPYDELLRYEDGRPGWRLVSQIKDWRPMYPQLYGLGHAMTIAIPCVLHAPTIIWREEGCWGEVYTRVYSGPDALQEIERICDELGIDDDFQAWEPGWEDRYSDEWGRLFDGVSIVRRILRLGHEHQLPAIFW